VPSGRRPYNMDAAFMQLQRHCCGSHAVGPRHERCHGGSCASMRCLRRQPGQGRAPWCSVACHQPCPPGAGEAGRHVVLAPGLPEAHPGSAAVRRGEPGAHRARVGPGGGAEPVAERGRAGRGAGRPGSGDGQRATAHARRRPEATARAIRCCWPASADPPPRTPRSPGPRPGSSCASAGPAPGQLYSAGPQGACDVLGGLGLPGSACCCGLVWVQSASRPLSACMVWVACRSGKLAVVPA
jgi:hypothetical protein